MTSFRRSLFGYRPAEVDAALSAREAACREAAAELARRDTLLVEHRAQIAADERRVAQLEAVCDRLSDRVVARDRELTALRAELARLGEDGAKGLRALTALAAELEGVRGQARGQATRIRLRALRDAADLGGRMTELARRPELRDGLLDDLRAAIARIGTEEPDHEADPVVPASRNGRALRSADDLFEGMVEIEVGPLADFSQLVGFEDAAGGIMATSQISVKRFAQGRATLEMKLAEPVELLRELEERSPFEFRVRDRRLDRLVLDVDAAEAA